jgi:hypothetical protein
MRYFLRGAFALGFCTLFGLQACDETRPVAPIHDGQAECEAIGMACHDPGVRFGGRYEECHDIGHEGEGKPCIAAYEECFTLCRAAPSGEGGAGGVPHGESGAGGEHAAEAGAGGAAGGD